MILSCIVLSILGGRERIGYLTNFNIQSDISTNNEYLYHAKIKYYNNFFRNSDIFGIYPNTNSLPEFIKVVKLDGKASPFGIYKSTKELDFNDKIDLNYTLKINYRIILFIIWYLTILPLIVFLINMIKSEKTYLDIKHEMNNREKKIIFIISCFIVSIIHVFLLNINYPLVGHDIALIQPRMISMFLFAQKNGLAVEWASPLFGGGLLQYAISSIFSFVFSYTYNAFLGIL